MHSLFRINLYSIFNMENEYLIKILLSVLLLLQAVDSKSYQTYNGYGKGFDDYASHKLFSRRQSRYPTGIFKKFPRSRSPFSLEGKMSRSFARSYDTEHFLKDRERESSIRESRYKEPRHESPRLYKHPRRMDPVHKDMKYKDPRFKVPRYEDIKYKDPRHKEPRHTDPRFKDPRYNDLKYKDPRYKDPRQKERKYKDPRLKDLSFPFRDLRKSRADWYKNRKISSVMPSRMEVSKSNSGKPREEFVYPHLGSAKSLFSSRKRPDKINRYPFDLSTYSKNKFRFSPAALSKARYNSREGRSEIEKRLLSRPPTSKARGKTKHYIRFNRYSDTIEGKKLSAYLDAMKEESDKAFMKTVYGLGMQKMVPDLEAIYYTDKDGKKRRKLYDPCRQLPDDHYVLDERFRKLFAHADPECYFVKCANRKAYLNPCSTATRNEEDGSGFCSKIDLEGSCGISYHDAHATLILETSS